MSSIDSKLVLLTCTDGHERQLTVHGSRRVPAIAGVPTVVLPARPGRAELDPVLDEHRPRRMLVHGTDADLAAVLLRLLRTERLDVELAYLPWGRSSGSAVWGLPVGDRAVSLAVDGVASAVPLARDDVGGVLVGRAEIRALTGECYCDEVLVLRGDTPRLVVAPGPAGIAVRAGRGGALPDGRVRAVAPTARRGRGSSVGRAVQVGGEPMTVVADGVAHPRPVPRRTWYRHTTDWLLVRP